MSLEFASIRKECSVPAAFIDFTKTLNIFKAEDCVWAAQADRAKIDDESITAFAVRGLTSPVTIGIRKARWMSELAMPQLLHCRNQT